MHLQRFLGEFDFTKKTQRITEPDMLHQLRNVLRFRAGDSLILVDGKGQEAAAKITKLSASGAEFAIGRVHRVDAEPAVFATLYAAVLKRENFEWAAQKAAEVGVKNIVPLITERTVKLNANLPRLEKILKEAAEQSGREAAPAISAPRPFDEAVRNAAGNDENLFFDRSGEDFDRQRLLKVRRIGVWIGPEGGWSARELASARASGFCVSSLGKLTLRAETAAVVASYLACHARIK
jgi:16S rRNA (uracil1498-N3)-methyltransferase